MDCLSYFSNCDLTHLQDSFIPEMDMIIPDMDMIIPDIDALLFQPTPEEQQQLCQDQAPSFGFDHLDPHPFLLPQETFSPNPNIDVFNLPQDLDSFFPNPKRQKIADSSYHCKTLDHFVNPNPNFVGSYIDIVPEVSTAFPEANIPSFPLMFDTNRENQNSCNVTKKPQVSSQSIAARERRRRIADKTQELGKLIPGGQKLNTAEMFQTAAKYVKFLQAQVKILQLMQSEMSPGSPNVEREMRTLLASQTIQDKFSSEEVCLVPKKLVESLATDVSICKTPKLFQDINKLMSPYD